MLNDKNAAAKDEGVMDDALKNYTNAALGVQAIAAEAAGYSKKSFEDAVSHVGTLASAKSFEAAMALQSNFARSCLEGFVTEAAKIGEMYAGLAKSVYEPYRQPAASAAGDAKDSAREAA